MNPASPPTHTHSLSLYKNRAEARAQGEEWKEKARRLDRELSAARRALERAEEAAEGGAELVRVKEDGSFRTPGHVDRLPHTPSIYVCVQRAKLAAAQAEGRELRGRVEALAVEHEERVTELLDTLQAVSVSVRGWYGLNRCWGVCMWSSGNVDETPKPTELTQVERAFEQAKAEHEQEQAQRQRAHEEAYRSAVEKRDGRLALLKVSQRL